MIIAERIACGFAAGAMLALPASALAGWGDENWGVLVWGQAQASPIPMLDGIGLVVLAGLLLGLGWHKLASGRRARADRVRGS